MSSSTGRGRAAGDSPRDASTRGRGPAALSRPATIASGRDVFAAQARIQEALSDLGLEVLLFRWAPGQLAVTLKRTQAEVEGDVGERLRTEARR